LAGPARARAARRLAAAAWALASGAALAQGAPAAAVIGDVARGRQLYESRCGACHSADAHRAGPMHRGVLGRKAGGAPGYEYSAALTASKLVWSRRTLQAWLADPEKLIPGQAMGFSVPDAKDRADIVAWLATLK